MSENTAGDRVLPVAGPTAAAGQGSHLWWKSRYWDARYTIGRYASRLGQRFGIHSLTYNSVIFDEFAMFAANAAPGFASCVKAVFPEAQSLIDIGCGTGHFVHSLIAAGVDARGYEHSSHARRFAKTRLGIDVSPLDLENAAGHDIRKADVVMSLEVAEHLTPRLGDRLIDLMVSVAPVAIFSAAPPGQGGTGHINERPKEYWRREFARRGFAFDTRLSAHLGDLCRERVLGSPWIAKNLMVFHNDDPALRKDD